MFNFKSDFPKSLIVLLVVKPPHLIIINLHYSTTVLGDVSVL